ncbi:MAG: SpoIID/LytB domain-containing protein [Firmicutes bacterium]|jgi:stage II sporulation protein D|nr:SpoIID/LytB domain-containing protein [Bacillota bacterium]HQD39668.1 SpoIID/LytB domain-containing protein [Bacillota bacterium]
MRKKLWLISLLLIVLLAGCGRQEEEQLPEEKTITIYDHKNDQKLTMPIEEYLQGVVAGEMKPGWPLEAYAAQAIVARTFTMEFINRGGTQKLHGTDVCTDETHTQAYNPSNINETIKKAVDSTRGQVLTYNGEYIKAWFNAACGGITARAKEGLAYPDAEPPYTVNKKCPEAKYSPSEVKSWSATFTYKELAELLKELEIKSVEKLEIAKKSDAGRVESWKIVHSGGSTEVSGQDLRLYLDPMRLRSNVITELVNGEEAVTIRGRGFGHGVGLCQWGAYTLAKEGKKAAEIAQYYFQGTKIEKRWR